jgi:hypothetical protein
MRLEEFNKLSWRQKQPMVVAMHVRNEMEDFHVSHISNAEMKELNPIIRRAVLEGLVIIEKAGWHVLRSPDKVDDPWVQMLAWLVQMIPEYWEVPTDSRIVSEVTKHKRN